MVFDEKAFLSRTRPPPSSPSSDKDSSSDPHSYLPPQKTLTASKRARQPKHRDPSPKETSETESSDSDQDIPTRTTPASKDRTIKLSTARTSRFFANTSKPASQPVRPIADEHKNEPQPRQPSPDWEINWEAEGLAPPSEEDVCEIAEKGDESAIIEPPKAQTVPQDEPRDEGDGLSLRASDSASLACRIDRPQNAPHRHTKLRFPTAVNPRKSVDDLPLPEAAVNIDSLAVANEYRQCAPCDTFVDYPELINYPYDESDPGAYSDLADDLVSIGVPYERPAFEADDVPSEDYLEFEEYHNDDGAQAINFSGDIPLDSTYSVHPIHSSSQTRPATDGYDEAHSYHTYEPADFENETYYDLHPDNHIDGFDDYPADELIPGMESYNDVYRRNTPMGHFADVSFSQTEHYGTDRDDSQFDQDIHNGEAQHPLDLSHVRDGGMMSDCDYSPLLSDSTTPGSLRAISRQFQEGRALLLGVDSFVPLPRPGITADDPFGRSNHQSGGRPSRGAFRDDVKEAERQLARQLQNSGHWRRIAGRS